MPLNPEPAPPTASPASAEFDPLDYWDLHKGKIIALLALFTIGALAFGLYSYSQQQKRANNRAQFAAAKSAEDYQKITSAAQGAPVAGNALLLLGEQQRKEGKFEESISTLRRFIKEHPEHPLISGAYTSLGATYEAQSKNNEALEIYKQAVAKFPGGFATPLALYSQAQILKGEGKSDEARRLYEQIVSGHPESIFAQESTRALKSLK